MGICLSCQLISFKIMSPGSSILSQVPRFLSFRRLTSMPLCVPLFLTHPSADAQGGFSISAVVNDITVNTEVQISLPDREFTSLGYICSKAELLDHMLVLLASFGGASVLLSIMAVPVCVAADSVRGFPLLCVFPLPL